MLIQSNESVLFNNYFKQVVLILLLSFTCLSWADTSSDDEVTIFDLSLAELLNVRVDVASYTSERIIQTPAIVSRYTQNDLTVMGIKTLKDMLSFIP
jgi:hypothetical protein